MSRIILSRYEDGNERVVVGWDHPAGGAFWQEFNPPWHQEEVSRFGGMWPGISLGEFRASLPDDLRPMISDDIMDLLRKHAEDPDSGYGPKSVIDLSFSQ